MWHALTIKEPNVVTGIAVLGFSGIVAFEAMRVHSWPELVLAASLWVLGLQFLRLGVRHIADISFTPARQRSRWLRFCLIAPLAVIFAYVLGYLVLMDRHLPTYPHDRMRFDSSFRWAGLEPRPGKLPDDRPWPYPNVTVWNWIYRPMDKISFTVYPRSREERESLRAAGWSW